MDDHRINYAKGVKPSQEKPLAKIATLPMIPPTDDPEFAMWLGSDGN